jgi:hypothetical protein
MCRSISEAQGRAQARAAMDVMNLKGIVDGTMMVRSKTIGALALLAVLAGCQTPPSSRAAPEPPPSAPAAGIPAQNYWQLQGIVYPPGTGGGTTGGVVTQADSFQCVDSFTGPKMTKQWNWTGTCGSGDSSGCYRYNFGASTADETRIDQRGVFGYQVTFPVVELNLWGALHFDNVGNKQMCVAGGAHVGRNPISMTWSGASGSKPRKNNFIGGAGAVTVNAEGVRVHNNHDPFYPDYLRLSNSWISWNRDDVVESLLFGIKIYDTLIDGTYSFLSDKDGNCSEDRDASGKTLVIENSLIRLETMYGGHAAKPNRLRHHWDMRGGHAGLWKHNNCPWEKWPKFELRNNIFLIEGPSLSRFGGSYDATETEFGLPSPLGANLANLTACSNNVFLYTNYNEWIKSGQEPGAVPKPGGKFYNASNPQFKRNGTDCYQRVTDVASDPGYGDVKGIWLAARQQWIKRHTGSSDPKQNVMMIPGVDYSVLQAGQSYQIRNRATGQCIQHGASGADALLARCNGSAAQLWVAEPRNDGKLLGAILLRDKSSGGYLRSQDEAAIHNVDGADNTSKFDPDIFWVSGGTPSFRERWYVYPLGGEPGGTAGTYAIESDGLRRTYVYGNGSKVQMQLLYEDGENTESPHNSPDLPKRNATRLQWYIEPK